MDLFSQLLLIKQYLAPWPALVVIAELAFKSLIVLATCFLFSLCIRKAAATYRHLLWSLCLLILCALPVFTGLLPKFVVTVESPSTQAMLAGTNAAAWPPPGLLEAYGTDIARFYLLGVLALVLYGLCGLLRMVLLTRIASDSDNEVAQSLLAEKLAEELSDMPVRLKEFPGAGSPLSWGLIHPTILLPRTSRRWDESRLRHVILHELAHIQRLDWVSQLVGRYVCAVFWYNPLVWFVARHVNELAEQSCDDLVLLQTRDHAGYADSLVTVAREKLQATRLPLLAQALVGSFLGSRIVAILDKGRHRKHNDSERVIAGVISAFSMGAMLSVLTVAPAPGVLANSVYGTSYISVKFLANNAAGQEASEVPTPAEIPPKWAVTANIADLETVHIQALPTQAPVVAGNEVRIPNVSLEAVAKDSLPAEGRLLYKRFPAYPAIAERRGVEGYTIVEYEIDASGQVLNPEVIKSTPHGIFEASSLKAIKEYRYDPPKVNGIPHGIKGLRTRFVFRMDSG